MFRLTLRTALLGAAFLVLGGCGGGDDRPRPVPATATVTMNGSPVDGATVTFSPLAESGQTAYGLTGTDGKVELTTYDHGDGAVPGSYKVIVTKTEVIGGATGEEDEDAEADEEDVTHRQLLPPKYGNLQTTDLTAEVKKGEDNDFTFDLK